MRVFLSGANIEGFALQQNFFRSQKTLKKSAVMQAGQGLYRFQHKYIFRHDAK